MYFKKAIPEILEDYNFRDDHKTIKEFITRQIGKGKHYFTGKYPNRLTSSKAPIHMLEPGREEEFMKWKEKQTKKVDSIQKDRIDELKKAKKVQYFKGLFHTTKRGKKKGDEVLILNDQFMKSGLGNLSDVTPLVGRYKYNVRDSNRKNKLSKSYVVGEEGNNGKQPTMRLMPYDLIPVFK